MTRTHLYEAANAIMTRKLGASRLRDWALAIAERTGPRKAKVALARKLAVILHATWRTDTPLPRRGDRISTQSTTGARRRATWMRPAGTQGEGEIAPTHAGLRPRTPLRSVQT